MDTPLAVAALSALAQPSRLAVFRALVARAPEGALPSKLAQQFGIPPNTLSFHLKSLAHAGLVSATQRGRCIRYRADLTRMQSLVDFLVSQCCGGDPSRCTPVRRGQCATDPPP
jgi:ArsR family transcriptional regulator, arsenate/arsenite/antimonite-responsive transcriptional repressor